MAEIIREALRKTTRDGRTAIVTIERFENGGGLCTVARREGQQLGSHCGPHHFAPNLPAGYVAAIGRLALTQAEADQVSTAWQEAIAALPRDLHAERRSLGLRIAGATDQWTADRAAAMDAEDEEPTMVAVERDRANEARIEEAVAALAAFDAEHPEVRAEVERRRDEQVARHMWD
jgi:hypothetical protein